MLNEILNKTVLSNIDKQDFLSEIRMRKNSNLVYSKLGKYYFCDYLVQEEDIIYTIKKSTNQSFYSKEDTIKYGYITYKGLRIGLAGEGVSINNQLTNIKNISSLCIRIPHDISFNDVRLNKIIDNFDNTLIISKPGFGKTTLLRYLIKQLSNKLYNILVIDEKGELSFDNTLSLGLGADVVINIEKIFAYKSFIKVLRPDILATDEVFGVEEIAAIKDSIRCGVKVIATLHANSYLSINQKEYAELLKLMKYIVVLDKVGQITNIYDRK